MITDIRLDVGFPGHKKTLRLIRRLSDPAAPWLLVKLWIYVAQHLPDGVLRGMDDDDIEAVAGWNGEASAFADALRFAGFVDVDSNGGMSCHDWLTHNPWVAGSDNRSDASRFSRLAQTAPNLWSELKEMGISSVSKDDYAAIKQAAVAGKKLADVVKELAINGERQRTPANASDPPAPDPVPIPSLEPKEEPTAAASSQASTTPTPPTAVEQQQPGKDMTVFAGSEERIRSAFREKHDFLVQQFPHLNLAVEVEQCVAKYRSKLIATDALVVVLEWCKRAQVDRPEARGRDRPSRQEEAVERGRANVRMAMEAIYAAEGV